MTMRSLLSLLQTILLLSMSACQSWLPVQTAAPRPVPNHYAAGMDTTQSDLLPRYHFFKDSNLLKLIDTAFVHNYDLQRAMQRVYMAQAGLLSSKRRFLPVVQLAGSASVDQYGDYTMNGVGNYDSNLSPNLNSDQRIPDPTPDFFLGLRSSWEIGLWGKYKNAKKAALLGFLASEKGKQLVKTSLVAEVAHLYYELLAMDNELLTIRKNLALQRSALSTIQEMKNGGMANELAVKQFHAQLLNTQGLEVQKSQQILQSENQLNLLLGRLPQPIPRGRPIREQALPGQLKVGIPSQMLLRRPDIQQAELTLEAAKLNVHIARAAFFPSLTLAAYTGFNAFKAPLLFSAPASLAYGALAGMTAPLVNRGIFKANYRRSQAMQQDAFYAYQQSISNGFQEVLTSLNGITNYQRMYDLKEEEVNNLLEAVAVSQSLFMAGYASYLEVITAQKYVLQAELELSETKKEQFMAAIHLYRALGGGWE